MIRRSGWERMAVIRPALLHGRRVDFWEACDLRLSLPGEGPAFGYWFDRSTGRMLAALDGRQSLLAVRSARRLARQLTLCLPKARAAEAGRALAWTSRLNPVPATLAGGLRGHPDSRQRRTEGSTRT